ncbi:MAG: VOC family protein [Myxococcales bacterium]|nr:VOC family protein [Myxococcales bacterium]
MDDAHETYGRFTHHELRSSDPPRARAFYQALFSWQLTPTPSRDARAPTAEPRETAYAITPAGASDPTPIGLIRPPSDPARTDRWIPHVGVRDATATAALARKLGGRELAIDPDDDIHLADPTDAIVAVRTADAARRGATPAPHGAFCWAQLLTRDVARARVFYNEVLGWRVDDFPQPDGLPSLIFAVAGAPVGGALQIPVDADASSSWLPYVAVSDIRAHERRARALGASTRRDVTELPGMGWFAVISDPLGANLALWQALAS